MKCKRDGIFNELKRNITTETRKVGYSNNSDIEKGEEKARIMNLVSATLDSTASATCQSSNKLGYSAGSAKESAAF